MEYILKTKVDVIKFDGTNKDSIIKRLGIKEYINLYFKKRGVYFIIPKLDESDWFILNEKLYNKKIDEYEKN